MIVVLASRYDAAAARLVERWAAHDAVLMTTDDLAAPGWRWTFGADVPSGSFESGGTLVTRDRIRGVLTRLPGVHAQELPFIAERDREYVAQEMHAFLLAWLTSLPCKVVNRPTPSSLMGVGWRREGWLLAARRVGLEVRPYVRTPHRLAPEPPHGVTSSVVVVGKRVLNAPDPVFEAKARALAVEAAAELLAIECELHEHRWLVRSVGSWLDFDAPSVADAVLECFS